MQCGFKARHRQMSQRAHASIVLIVAAVATPSALAQHSAEELAKLAQNKGFA